MIHKSYNAILQIHSEITYDPKFLQYLLGNKQMDVHMSGEF